MGVMAFIWYESQSTRRQKSSNDEKIRVEIKQSLPGRIDLRPRSIQALSTSIQVHYSLSVESEGWSSRRILS